MSALITPVRADASDRTPASRCVRTTCPYCGTGCGIDARLPADLDSRAVATIEGDRLHPTNSGSLCSKGSHLGETLSTRGRLLRPELDGQPCHWEQALDAAAERLGAIIETHGPDAVAFYCSGQLLTEDYYVANKLMKGFIGSANIDTNSRLCMSSAVVGHKRAFGSDSVPACYLDLELADLVVLTGSNAAWCHPILFQRIRAAKQAHPGKRLVVIDPRRTASCDDADLHLPIKPGTDALLFNGLLNWLAEQQAIDPDYIARHTEQFDSALAAARSSAPDIATVAAACELEVAAVEHFFRWFAETPKTLTAFSQGVNQSSAGSDKVNAIINVHLATGRVGRPGASPFSLTGQPNAMGGREVGGLANQLAAHMNLEDPRHRALVAQFWGSERVPEQAGLKAVELFEAIEAGRVKAVWVMATNPVDSLPDADRVRAALERCELVILSDCMDRTDTAASAHIRFPATAWGERDGTVTNAERCISRQRPLQPSAGESRPDWWIICQLARRLGFGAAFDYQAPWQIFREHAALSVLDNRPDVLPRGFNLGPLAHINSTSYEALAPIQWPVSMEAPAGSARRFDDGRFDTDNGRARFVPIQPRPPHYRCDHAYPLVLNTGRVRDQWHTMTRTGLSPSLSGHRPEPEVSLHPDDAARYGLRPREIARLRSRWGRLLARVALSDQMRPGELFVPMHWNDQFAREGRVGALVNPATDPLSGQPESKHTPVAIEALDARWYGILLSRNPLPAAADSADYRTRICEARGERLMLAGSGEEPDWPSTARRWLGGEAETGAAQEWIEYEDRSQGVYRLARLREGRLQALLWVDPDPELPDTQWLGALLDAEPLEPEQRRALLSGLPPQGTRCGGATVCACFGVGKNTLLEAIRTRGLNSVDALGQALKAGTNCGSCLPELRALIQQQYSPRMPPSQAGASRRN
ncbi:nitrate reductase [Aestuariirhabdus litorea]|uniref:Nitrate reductase n=1 Tax=Aestuariirhabdus litorea TaxID=2528527 RepID=A0A3P3VMR4_9GAMM|nr:nitrate reductase [Aestuariirhabdus litorea]RRJ83975.1 nitrate reductase [Aestuariirhabdus litorea]RWW97195.1 nitrate reductase [Endozoicomonadaceae bacterium GTF-13]